MKAVARQLKPLPVQVDSMHGQCVAQISKPAVSRVSKPAGRLKWHGPPTWKSAIQQVWKPALRTLVGLSVSGWASLPGQTLNLPARTTNAPTGSELVLRLTPLELEAREREIFAQVAAGNVPDFLRKLCPVAVTSVVAGRTNLATLFVTPDYLALGTDDDYFLTPLTPVTAQRIADLAGVAVCRRAKWWTRFTPRRR